MTLSDLLIDSLGVKGFFKYIKNFAKDMEHVQSISTIKFKKEAKKYSFWKNLCSVYFAATSIEVVLEDMPKNKCGYYNHKRKIMVINKNNLSDIADTIAHEFTHAVQHYLGYDFNNYIQYNKNKEKYQMQLVEQEAFAMGQRWAVELHKVQSYIKKRGLAILS